MAPGRAARSRAAAHLVHSGPGGALVTGVSRLWYQAFAPFGHDDLTLLEHHLAGAASWAAIDLRSSGPSGVGFGVMRRLVDWRAAGRLPERIVFSCAGGTTEVILRGVARALCGRAAIMVHAPCEDASVDAAARAFGAHAESLIADHRVALAPWISLRLALLARPKACFSDLARAHGTSAVAWRRELASLGGSFRAERQRTRMELAYERIVSGRDKLSAIASEVGFASESQLCRAFRRHFGATPSTLRGRPA